MPFPNFAGKHAEDAFFTAADFVAYMRRAGRLPEMPVLAGVMFCYQRGYAKRALERHQAEPFPAVAGLHILRDTPQAVGVCMGFGIGAPAAAAQMEPFIALGVQRFASIGTAGALQPHLAIGDIILCDRAIRDEGVSHHYLPAEKYSAPSPELTAKLGAALAAQGSSPSATGTTWTIDAPYRETVAEARHYQSEGVLCIDMEAAALFAVAQVRGAQVASAFVVSDSLADLEWNPQFDADAVEAGFNILFNAAIAALIA